MRKLVGPFPGAEAGSLRSYVEPFKEWQGVKGYTPFTIEVNAWRLFCFIKFCEERGVSRAAEVSRQVVDRYQRHLYHARGRGRGREGKPLGMNYQSMMLRSIRVFFKWLAKERHILYNPASEIEYPKVPRRLPRAILTSQEAEAVLSAVDLSTPIGLRDRAILELLYSNGIRRMEVANLLMQDLDAHAGTLFVKEGKGRKDRFVPVGDRALLWLRKYLEDGRPALQSSTRNPYLFLNVLGEQMGLDYLGNVVTSWVQKAGLAKKGGCQMFRHSVATLMLENGADIRYVQAMLGHESLETTQIYTHVSIQKLKEIHRATHPARLPPPPPPPPGAPPAP